MYKIIWGIFLLIQIPLRAFMLYYGNNLCYPLIPCLFIVINLLLIALFAKSYYHYISNKKYFKYIVIFLCVESFSFMILFFDEVIK